MFLLCNFIGTYEEWLAQKANKKEEQNNNCKEESVVYNPSTHIRHNYKDSVFRMIFSREEYRQDLLDIYNALNNSAYKDKNELKITTIDNVIYMTMKNDLSFLLDSRMVLYEHQSTFNPNMPLRGFLYFGDLYYRFLGEKSIERIYRDSLVKIPTPQFVVFYNGVDRNIADKTFLKLSDAFEHKDKTNGFEWTATMLNINYGHNKELMLKCKKLEEYSEFVALVRKFRESTKDLDKAMDLAMDYAIKHSILSDFLRKERAAVKMTFLTEFSMENYEKTFREDIEYERARADKAEARIAEAEAKTAEAEAKTAEAEAKTAEAEAITKATLLENEHLKKILREHNIDI